MGEIGRTQQCPSSLLRGLKGKGKGVKEKEKARMSPGGNDFVSLDAEPSCSSHLEIIQLEVEGPWASLALSSSVDLAVSCNKGQQHQAWPPGEGTHVVTSSRGLTSYPSRVWFCPPSPHPPHQSFFPSNAQNGELTPCALQRQKRLGFNIYRLEQWSSKNCESLQENVKNCTPSCTILSSHPQIFYHEFKYLLRI